MPEAQKEAAVATIGRNQSVVYVLPHTVESIPEFLGPALDRIDPDSAAVQAIVVTADSESALAVAQAAHAMSGATGIEVLPVTSAPRAARLLRARPVRAVAGSPEELLALVSGTHLKLDSLRVIVISWVEDILDQSESRVSALETLLSEAGKDVDRVIVTRKSDPRVEEFIERYARRPRRISPAQEVPSGPAALPGLSYVTTAAVAKPLTLRRLLDELDPPSAAVVVRTAPAESEARSVLHGLGYRDDDETICVSRGAPSSPAHTVILYDAPVRPGELAALSAAGPVSVIALTLPSEVAALRELSGVAATPFNFATAAGKLRRRDDALRNELRSVLAAGVPPREIAPLEPLLAEYDAVEIAAAALQLLERERRVAKAAPTSPAAGGTSAVPRFPGGASPGEPMVKLFVTVGERDSVKPGDLVGTIAGETGIAGDRIGKIDMFDAHSIVEVPAAEAERIVSSVNGKMIRGRKVVVRADRPKSERADRGERGERGARPDRPDRFDRPARNARPGSDRGGRDAPRRGSDRPGSGRSSGPPRRGTGERRPGGRR
jgi:ATP-dependent RNA helicase DeaD